jgi:hypothetical protein
MLFTILNLPFIMEFIYWGYKYISDIANHQKRHYNAKSDKLYY